MPLLLAIAFLGCAHAFDPWQSQAPLGPETNCAIRELALEYARTRGGATDDARIKYVYEALLTGDGIETPPAKPCNVTAPPDVPVTPPSFAITTDASHTFFVDYDRGIDTGGARGTEAAPFRTIAHALAAARAAPGAPAAPRAVVLRAGTHYLDGAPLALGTADSNTALQNYPGEAAWVSGGMRLDGLEWTPHARPGTNASATCAGKCAEAGHCCVGNVSSWVHPSCAMGCSLAASQPAGTPLEACLAGCSAADAAGCKWTVPGTNDTWNMCQSCPPGCDARDGVGECFQGCEFAHGARVLNMWVADMPERVARVIASTAAGGDGSNSAGNGNGGNGTMWGLNTEEEAQHEWHTRMTRARYPNIDPFSGTVERKYATIGKNASWDSAPYQGFGVQVVTNMTEEVPKSTTDFPDYFVQLEICGTRF